MAKKNLFNKKKDVVEVEAEEVKEGVEETEEVEDVEEEEVKDLIIPKKKAEPVVVESSSPIIEASFDDDIDIGVVKKMKMKEGEEMRATFLIFNDNADSPAPSFLISETIYDDVTKTTFCAPRDKKILKDVCQKLGKSPNKRFGCVLLQYTVDDDGDLVGDGYKLHAWVFGRDKFPDLKEIQKEWGLINSDIKIVCKEEEFQKYNISPCRDRWFDSFDSEMQESIYEEAMDMYTNTLPNMMGKVMEDEEILNHLGMAGGGPKNKSLKPFQGVGEGGGKKNFSKLIASKD